jgi:hypothetical protein
VEESAAAVAKSGSLGLARDDSRGVATTLAPSATCGKLNLRTHRKQRRNKANKASAKKHVEAHEKIPPRLNPHARHTGSRREHEVHYPSRQRYPATPARLSRQNCADSS